MLSPWEVSSGKFPLLKSSQMFSNRKKHLWNTNNDLWEIQFLIRHSITFQGTILILLTGMWFNHSKTIISNYSNISVYWLIFFENSFQSHGVLCSWNSDSLSTRTKIYILVPMFWNVKFVDHTSPWFMLDSTKKNILTIQSFRKKLADCN